LEGCTKNKINKTKKDEFTNLFATSRLIEYSSDMFTNLTKTTTTTTRRNTFLNKKEGTKILIQ